MLLHQKNCGQKVRGSRKTANILSLEWFVQYGVCMTDRPRPIMIKFLPNMLVRIAQKSPIILNSMPKYASKFYDFN